MFKLLLKVGAHLRHFRPAERPKRRPAAQRSPEVRSLVPTRAPAAPRIWGLEPIQIHDRFWASRGVQVVRQGRPAELEAGAELFLLMKTSQLAVFRLGPLVETLSWLRPRALFVRLSEQRENHYREIAVFDREQRFVRYRRLYADRPSRVTKLVLTPDRELARLWQKGELPATAWRRIRSEVQAPRRATAVVRGKIYDAGEAEEVMRCVQDLIKEWRQPSSTIPDLVRKGREVWMDPLAEVDPTVHFVGPVWVGAGRRLRDGATVAGPAVLWDDPAVPRPVPSLDWSEIEPTSSASEPVPPRAPSRWTRFGKRAFDLAMAALGLLLTLPLYPFIMLAIWLEDGRPFFFAHSRETRGGRVFPCLKFRSMRKDAEAMKARLQEKNLADGPQFFIPDDPRLLRVGKFLRDTKLDELPQLLNVLVGHMSIVGPRPSPHDENQFCPPWREARLSVRPGITGLWQVMRTRQRGLDFQEWIRYDIEYVERASWRLDLWIIWRTIWSVVLGR